VWLARRFTAPGCEPVCCDGNAPFPFARGAFGLAMCTDAFMYIWTKRQFVGEMTRLVDHSLRAPLPSGAAAGAVLIGHTHNERTWSPSHGQPLAPDGYADLFESIEPRIFAEGNLFEDVVTGGPLDLSRRDDEATLDAAAALTIVATKHPGVFVRHPIAARPPSGELRVNPLYAAEPVDGDRVHLRLRFPSEDYEQEYGACRRYLPDEATIDRAALDALPSLSARSAREPLPPAIADLARRRVLLDLPVRYY
jgi:hypothetical protein